MPKTGTIELSVLVIEQDISLNYAIMQSTAGYYGHVAIVERVYSSGKILVSEYNYNRPLAYSTRYISASAARTITFIN